MLFKTRKTLQSISSKNYVYNAVDVSAGDNKRASISATKSDNPMYVFRREFVTRFMQFYDEVNLLATGMAGHNESWKDKVGKEGLGVVIATSGIVLSFLGAFSVISAVATAGATIVPTVVGIAGGIAWNKYRDHKKEKQYERAHDRLNRETLEEDVEEIAKSLTKLYRMQLKRMTVKDAAKLARSCFIALANEIRKEADCNIDELMHPVYLQATLIHAKRHVPKQKMEMNIDDQNKYNTRSMVQRSALYCKENNKIYAGKRSRPDKYGFLMFDTKEEVKDYKAYVKGMKGRKIVKDYRPVSNGKVAVLKQGKLFKEYRHQVEFGCGDKEPVPLDPTTRKTV